jgi:hypothetical protein
MSLLRRPDPMRSEAALHRSFPASVYNSIVYFEQAVLADSATFRHVGYRTFVVTQDTLYWVDLAKPSGELPLGVPLDAIDLVEVMEDAAQFLPEDLAALTTHIRVHVSPALPALVPAGSAVAAVPAGPLVGGAASAATVTSSVAGPSAPGAQIDYSSAATAAAGQGGRQQSVMGSSTASAAVSAAAAPGLVDFYAIYEDSQLLYYLQRTWLHAKTVWPQRSTNSQNKKQR